MAHRTFEDTIAERTDVPLWVGLVGPSFSGKTYTALRLATGIQRHRGGDIWMIDTEAGRGRHYADKFRYRYVQFTAPFSPLDYLAAIEHCVRKGASTIIIDSMSHEHEGPGGVLEMHEVELKRMGGQAGRSFGAWAGPKAARQKMINTMLQLPVSFLLCFRAKDKKRPATDEEKAAGNSAPVELGFMPIAGHELIFEMTVNMLFLPSAGGVPTWYPEERGEKQMIKVPEDFRGIFLGVDGPVTEDHGEAMSKWAAGVTKLGSLEMEAVQAQTTAELDIVRKRAEEARGAMNRVERQALRWLFERRQKHLVTRQLPMATPTETPPEAA